MARVFVRASLIEVHVQGGGNDEEQSSFMDLPSKTLKFVSPFDKVAKIRTVAMVNVGENIFTKALSLYHPGFWL